MDRTDVLYSKNRQPLVSYRLEFHLVSSVAASNTYPHLNQVILFKGQHFVPPSSPGQLSLGISPRSAHTLIPTLRMLRNVRGMVDMAAVLTKQFNGRAGMSKGSVGMMLAWSWKCGGTTSASNAPLYRPAKPIGAPLKLRYQF